MLHGNFKPGEICRAEGTYECWTCRQCSRDSRVQMERDKSFPECASCKERGALEVDTLWKLVAGR